MVVLEAQAAGAETHKKKREKGKREDGKGSEKTAARHGRGESTALDFGLAEAAQVCAAAAADAQAVTAALTAATAQLKAGVVARGGAV